MVKALILYYLNIKATHGYEIQKYMQTSGFDVWANIKPGSIYYALGKMEEKGEIELVKEENRGSRVRRIYKITEKGRKELEKILEKELSKQLMPLNVEKFILPITFNRIKKENVTQILTKHIEELKKTLEYWKYWQDMKSAVSFSKVEKISFEMTITNIEYSIKWHLALIEEYDMYSEIGHKQEQIIESCDFAELPEKLDEPKDFNEDKIKELRDKILNNPERSKETLEELIRLMTK